MSLTDAKNQSLLESKDLSADSEFSNRLTDLCGASLAVQREYGKGGCISVQISQDVVILSLCKQTCTDALCNSTC